MNCGQCNAAQYYRETGSVPPELKVIGQCEVCGAAQTGGCHTCGEKRECWRCYAKRIRSEQSSTGSSK